MQELRQAYILKAADSLEGRVSELTRTDLCFNREEAEEFWGFFDEAAYTATEGWALAMQSYRMAAEGNPDLSISKIRADRDIHRYLMDEIFGKLSPGIRRFLLCTSLLPNLEVRMCDSLLGIGNSRDILEELASRNIFTLRISGSTYRYHELFRDFLQQNDDGTGLETVRRAMAWHFDRGEYEQAADYALIADDAKFIHDCIGTALGRPFAGGRYRRLKEYFDCLEAHHTELTPRVLLAKGMYLSSRGNFFEADRDLSAAIDRIGIEERAVYLYDMTHKARVLRNNVSFEESSRCLDILLPLQEGQPMATWYAVVIEKVYNLILTSQLTAALELTRAMIEKCSVCGDLRVKAWFERYLTAVCFFMGDYKNSLLAYEKSLSIPEEEQDWLMRHSVGAYAAICLREGDETAAVEYARKFMELSQKFGHRFYFQFKPLFTHVLQLAGKHGITPEFTREMLSYGGYKTQRIYINTLGGIYMAPDHDRKKPIKIRTQKAREFLAYLLENRGGATRERIYSDIWGHGEANVTRLFHTRRGEIKSAFQSLGAGNPILHENGVYRLCMDEAVCDLDAFEQAAAGFEREPTQVNAQKVVNLYGGRYLNDMEALWAESTRLRCEETFIRAAEVLLDSYTKSGERAKTMELIRRCAGLRYKGPRYEKT